MRRVLSTGGMRRALTGVLLSVSAGRGSLARWPAVRRVVRTAHGHADAPDSQGEPGQGGIGHGSHITLTADVTRVARPAIGATAVDAATITALQHVRARVVRVMLALSHSTPARVSTAAHRLNPSTAEAALSAHRVGRVTGSPQTSRDSARPRTTHELAACQ